MRIEISAGDDVLKRFHNQLGALTDKRAHQAQARAINRVTGMVYGRVARAAAKQSSIPLKIVRGQMRKRTVRPGSAQALQGSVYATGRPLSLKVFKAKQFSYGVKVKTNGKFNRMPGLFIKAGSFRGVKNVAGGHIFQRDTRASLPIAKQYGPSVPEHIIKDAARAEFERTVRDMLPARLSHEIGRLLPKD